MFFPKVDVLCANPVYKNKLCKKHFLHNMKKYIRQQLSVIYRDPESAYTSFDFNGSGKIRLKEFLNHPCIKKMETKYSEKDI